jgi:hypothetical protein
VKRESIPELERRGWKIADWKPGRTAHMFRAKVGDKDYTDIIAATGLEQRWPAFAVFEGDVVVARHYGFHDAEQLRAMKSPQQPSSPEPR